MTKEMRARLHMSEDLEVAIKQLAKQHERSFNAEIIWALRQYIEPDKVIREIPDSVMNALKEQAEAEGLSREEYLRMQLVALAHHPRLGAETRKAVRARFTEAQTQLAALFEDALRES